MMQVRRPVLLDSNLAEAARLWPVSGSQTVTLRGASEATIALPEDAPDVHIHDWISIYNAHGFSGVYRVSNVAHTYTDRTDITLLHGIDILNDSVWAAQTDFEGTVAQFLTAILNQQTHLVRGIKPWVLGTCADTSTLPKQTINYNRLSDLFWGIEEEGGGYYFTFDQTQWPWVVNYVALPDTVQSEFRLARNVRSATVTLNDADLCTRLILSINEKVTTTATIPGEPTQQGGSPTTDTVVATSNETAIKTYDDATAQAAWGVVVKTADIDTQDDLSTSPLSTPQADAWAANYLAHHNTPSVQVQIDGDDLKALTGDTWDETRRGTLCRVALPAYGVTLNERVESITYPQLFDGTDKDPTHVTVSLANTLPKVSESIASIRTESAKTARTARGTARTATDSKAEEEWHKHVSYYGNALDGTDVLTIYESGIDMTPIGGVIIKSLRQGMTAAVSQIKVNSDSITLESSRIDLVVSGSGSSASIRIDSIVDGINQSAVEISADRIYLNGQTKISDLFTGNAVAQWLKTNRVDVGNLYVASDGGLYLYDAGVNQEAEWKSTYVVTQSPSVSMPSLSITQRDLVYISNGAETHANYYVITSYTAGSVSPGAGATLHYLGRNTT